MSVLSDSPDPRGAPALRGSRDDRLPDDLPPVEPPSAGFIVQLFVVPALIVLAVVGVWALFGTIASSEQNWQELVKELRSGNEHRRWRAALGLAQMLKGDEERGDAALGLARDSKVCEELTSLLKEELARPSASKDELKHQAFLARTLGFLDRPDIVLPALVDAAKPSRDVDVRRNALASIALVLGRSNERGESAADEPLVDALMAVADETDLPMRQLAVYALGLAPLPSARQKLEALATNSSEDATIRGNAAVGLARQGSTAGLPYFREILVNAGMPPQGEAPQYVDLVTVRNTIKAVTTLKNSLTDQERAELAGLLGPVSQSHRDPRIRLDATTAMKELQP